MRLVFCFSLGFILCPLLASSLSQTRSFSDAFPNWNALRSQPSIFFLCDYYREFSCAFLITMRVFCVFFLLNVQSLRLLSLVFADSLISALNFVCLAHSSALSRFERSFCTFLLRLRLFSVITVTFRDFDLDIPSVCVHIFPRRTLAYQVSVFLVCQYLEERYQWSCIGIVYHFLIIVLPFFLIL